MVPADSDRISRVPSYSGNYQEDRAFCIQDSYLLWLTFPGPSTILCLCNSSVLMQQHQVIPATPIRQRPHAMTSDRFRLIPFRSPLLRESRLISFPQGTKMFQFPWFPSIPYGFRHGCQGITPGRFPHSEIPGSKPVRRLPEAYRSLPRPSSAIIAKASTVCP